jgi:hypothetical protein
MMPQDDVETQKREPDSPADPTSRSAIEAELAAFRLRLSSFGLGEDQRSLLTGEVPPLWGRKRR